MPCHSDSGTLGLTCSGRGQCVDSICICDKYWSSIGAFQLVEGVNCGFHVPSLNYLAIILMIISIPVTVIHFIELRNIFRAVCPNFKKNIILAGFVTNSALYTYAILNLVDREKFVWGRSPLTAVVMTFLYSGIYAVAVIYCKQLVYFVKGYMKMLDKDTREYMKFVLPLWTNILNSIPIVVFILFLVVQFIGIYAVNPAHSEVIYIIISSIVLLFSIVILIFLNTVFRIFINELKKANDNQNQIIVKKSNPSNENPIQNLINSSREIYLVFSFQCIVQVLIMCFDVSWHLARAQASYSILISMILINIGAPFFLKSFMTNINNKLTTETSDVIVSRLNSIASVFIKSAHAQSEKVQSSNHGEESLRNKSERNKTQNGAEGNSPGNINSRKLSGHSLPIQGYRLLSNGSSKKALSISLHRKPSAFQVKVAPLIPEQSIADDNNSGRTGIATHIDLAQDSVVMQQTRIVVANTNKQSNQMVVDNTLSGDVSVWDDETSWRPLHENDKYYVSSKRDEV